MKQPEHYAPGCFISVSSLEVRIVHWLGYSIPIARDGHIAWNAQDVPFYKFRLEDSETRCHPQMIFVTSDLHFR
jgi:hypothetical protein